MDLSKIDFDDIFSKNLFTLDKKTYINCSFSFDIETTSMMDSNNEKIAFPYFYSVGVNHEFWYTRYLDVFLEFIKNLNKKLEKKQIYLICFVHNLSFEFTFLSHFLDFTDIFCRKKLHVMKCFYGNIDFRCTYFLSNMSLKTLASKYTITQKMVGDLDYKKIRFPETHMSKKEILYCENDVIILNEYWEIIYKEFIEGKKKAWLPLTNTAKVRHYVKNKIDNFYEYHNKLEKIFPDQELNKKLELAFQGGLVLANPLFTDIEVKNVRSFDKKSSYPYEMVTGKYPMSKFTKIDVKKNDEFDDKDYCKLITVKMYNIKSIKNMKIISFSKLLEYSEDLILANGRLIEGSYCKTICTELDFKLYQKYYDFTYEFEEILLSKKGHLPKFLILSIVHFFKEKNKYSDLLEKSTGAEKEEYKKMYMNTKNMINSLFGMMCTKIDGKKIIFSNNYEWGKEDEDYKYKFSTFLVMQWGVWVTANARFSLLELGYQVDKDVCYMDTDCNKIFDNIKNRKIIEKLNFEIGKRLKESCDFYGIKENDLKNLGQWENEGLYEKFKTLGSKKYVSVKEGVCEPTCSGISKESLKKYCKKHNLDLFEFFEDGAAIPSDETRKITLTYSFNEKIKDFKYIYDGIEHTLKIGNFAHASDASFKISITNEYKKILEIVQTIEMYQW